MYLKLQKAKAEFVLSAFVLLSSPDFCMQLRGGEEKHSCFRELNCLHLVLVMNTGPSYNSSLSESC